MGERKTQLPRFNITTVRPRPGRGIAIVAAICLAALAGAWWAFRQTASVGSAPVVVGTAAQIVYGTGAVEPERWAKVATLIKGRIVERCRCEGKSVKDGDLLARLDDKEAQAALRELKAREEFEQRQANRQRELARLNVTTNQLLERAETDLIRTQALISIQIERIESYRLLSPMDGIVLREDGEVGEVVDSNTILYRVGLPQPLQLVAAVNEEDVPMVKVGQKVLLRSDAFTGQKLTGRVQEITPAGDPIAKTYRVRVALPEDTPLMIGMSVEANIIVNEKANALLIPAAAVLQGQVFVLQGSRAERKKIDIGIRGTQNVEVLSGLGKGDLVVSPALPTLRDGARVRIIDNSSNTRP